MLVFVFSLVERLMSRDKARPWIFWPGLAAILAALLFSLTRSAWLGVAVALALFALFQRPRLALAALPLALALLLLLPTSVRSRFYSIFDPQDESNRDRLHMAYTGWQIFRHYPLTGVGANNIPLVYARFQHPESRKVNPHLHNNALQILGERGPGALLALAAAFVAAIVGLSRRLRGAAPPLAGRAAGSLYALVAFLTAGLFEYNFGDSEIKFLLFYLLCLPYCGGPRSEP